MITWTEWQTKKAWSQIETSFCKLDITFVQSCDHCKFPDKLYLDWQMYPNILSVPYQESCWTTSFFTSVLKTPRPGKFNVKHLNFLSRLYNCKNISSILFLSRMLGLLLLPAFALAASHPRHQVQIKVVWFLNEELSKLWWEHCTLHTVYSQPPPPSGSKMCFYVYFSK